MTNVTRTELRRMIEAALSAADQGAADLYEMARWLFRSRLVKSDSDGPEQLTPFKLMCLAGLVGDPAQLESALADYLLDMGHEYAVECYEKGKREERERCVKVCEGVSERLKSEADLLERQHRVVPPLRWELQGAYDCVDAIRGLVEPHAPRPAQSAGRPGDTATS